MTLKSKIIGAVVASALACPPAFAVEGSDGMHYTSASEGFYASIRVRFNSGGSDGANSVIQNSSSRLGLQGTGEMSHGLEGFYRYETAFDVNNGAQGFGNTRLAYVGLRGGFGSFRVGSDWADEYNWVYGSTDIANVNSGNFAYNDDFAGRSSRSLFYKTPNFNGLEVAARFEMDGGSNKQDAPGDWRCDGDENMAGIQPPTLTVPVVVGTVTTPVNFPSPTVPGRDSDGDYACAAGTLVNLNEGMQVDSNDGDLDAWVLSGKYEFSGFTLAGSYLSRPDYGVGDDGGREDKTAWALGGNYGQDNWKVALWYGENNQSEFDSGVMDVSLKDETTFSIAANVGIGKTGVYIVHENKELNMRDGGAYTGMTGDDAFTTFGVEYNLNSKAKTWVEFASQDLDSSANAKDYVTIGLRHDF